MDDEEREEQKESETLVEWMEGATTQKACV